jgi:hypothetical protein
LQFANWLPARREFYRQGSPGGAGVYGADQDIGDHKLWEAPAFAGKVDHVSLYFNPGHPGVDVPHYHFVVWHVAKKEEARVGRSPAQFCCTSRISLQQRSIMSRAELIGCGSVAAPAQLEISYV